MPRSRNKEERRKGPSADTVTEEPFAESAEAHSPEQDPEPIPDVLVHINYTLLAGSAAAIALCLAVIYFIHGYQVRKNAERMKDMADAAEAAGDPQAAITHLTRYLNLQRELFDSSEAEPEETATLARLARLLTEHAGSRSDLERAYDSFEAVLRNDPARHDERKQLVDVCMDLRRYRDALQHLTQLFDTDSDAAGDTHLLLQEALAHAGLREYVDSQQSFCDLIAADPGDCEPYLSVARLITEQPQSLWYRDPDATIPEGEAFILRAFPEGESGRFEQNRQAALKTAEAILDVLVERGQPAWDAHRRRALFLASLQPSLDVPSQDQPTARTRSDHLMIDLDKDHNGALDAAESRSPLVPAFSDINHDGAVDKGELVLALKKGGLTRRMEEAKSSINEALSLVEQAGRPADRARVLGAAAEVDLALAEKWEYEDYERAKGYVSSARDAAEQAAVLSDRSPESLLSQARLELRARAFESNTDVRQQCLEKAESLLSDARAILADDDQLTNSEKATTTGQQSPTDTLIEVEATLGDVLVSQIQTQTDGDPSGIKSRIRDDIIPSLEEYAAAANWVHFLKGEVFFVEQQWRKAESEYRAAAAGIGPHNDLLRRIGLRRARCARKLADPQASVARALSVHQSDPNWAGGRIELAQAYENAGNLDAALAEYARYGRHPDITPTYVRLLIQREADKPFAQRVWRTIERAFETLESQEQNAAQVPVLQSSLLLQQALTDQLAHQSDEGTGIAADAREKLQAADDLLRQAVGEFPEDVEIRSALARLTVLRFDLPVEARVKLCDDILTLARDQLGDSVTLRLAYAHATRLVSDDDAVAALQELHHENPDFTPQDRADLLAGLAPLYVGRGKREPAIAALTEAARLVPTEIAISQAALDQMILYAVENNGKFEDQQARWDDMLEQVERIEGGDGPLSAYYQGALLVVTTPAVLDRLSDDDLQKRFNDAHALLRAAQRQRPRSSRIPRMLGELETLRYGLAQQKGDGDALRFQEAAVAHFEEAVEREDYSETVVGRLVEFYLEHHREQDARRLLDRVARNQPQGLTGQLVSLGWRVESRLKEQSLAVDAYIKQASGAGEGAAAKIRAALMLMTRGETGPQVEKLLLEACELEPQSSGPWEWIVRYYTDRTRYVAARGQIDEAEQALPDGPPFLKPRTIARCYRILRRRDAENRQKWQKEAEQHYLAAVEADPRNIDLKRELAEFYTEANRLDAARQTLAAILDPQSGASPQARDWALTHRALIDEDPLAGLARLQDAKPVDDRGRIENLRAQVAYFTSLNRPSDRPDMLAVLDDLHRLTRGNLTTRERFQFTSLLQADGDWRRAHEIYREWLDSSPQDTIALSQFIASLIRHVKDESAALTQARTYWETLRSLEPETYRTHALGARLLAAEQRPEQAAEQLSTFVLQFADVTVDDVFVKLRDQTSAEDAIALLASAEHLTADPTVAAELKKARDLQADGESDKALAVLNRLAGAEQSVVNLRSESIKNAAELIEGFGQAETAEKLYAEYGLRSPRPEAPLELARFLGRQKRFDEALDICRAHWEDIPAETVGSLAAALLRAKGASDSPAVSDFVGKLKASLDDAPDDDARRDRLFELANLYDLQQNYDAAEAAYAQIIQFKPDDVTSANNLAFIWARRGKNLPQALQLINDQLTAIGQSAELLDTQAVVLLAAGKADQAVEILEAVSGQIPAPLYFLHLAEAQSAAGRSADAEKSLQAAIDKGLAVDGLHPFDFAAYRRLKAGQ